MHYVLIGERLGYRPNAFFDPHYFRDRAGVARNSSRGLLELYLARPEAAAPSPSAEFDHAWYVSQNPDWMRSHPHPFLHFLESGMRDGRRPRADIDLEFVRDVIRGASPARSKKPPSAFSTATLTKASRGRPSIGKN